MVSLFSYLLTFFAVVFWAFRAIATVLFQLDIDFFAEPLNEYYEIMVLFATLPCLILVVKRNVVGAAAYLGIYVTYFGTTLYNIVVETQAVGLTVANSANLMCTVIGVIVPMLIFLDILLNKNRQLGKGNSKSDWFYKDEKFDRKFDERADRNQYKI